MFIIEINRSVTTNLASVYSFDIFSRKRFKESKNHSQYYKKNNKVSKDVFKVK